MKIQKALQDVVCTGVGSAAILAILSQFVAGSKALDLLQCAGVTLAIMLAQAAVAKVWCNGSAKSAGIVIILPLVAATLLFYSSAVGATWKLALMGRFSWVFPLLISCSALFFCEKVLRCKQRA